MSLPGILNTQTRFCPGPLVPFDGHGSSYESNSQCFDIAVVSCGLIQMTIRDTFGSTLLTHGPGNLVLCSTTGMLVPKGRAVLVEGRWHSIDNAPAPRVNDVY